MVIANTIYYQDEIITVQQPQAPLAPGALEIVVKPGANYDKVYEVYSKIKHYWNIATFYLERRDGDTTIRQIIPYPQSSVLRKIQVTWNLLFPSLSVTRNALIGSEEGLRNALSGQEVVLATEAPIGSDAFCNQDRINAQRISEQKNTNLLCNFKPITSHDFLITSKAHTELFDKESFVEAMNLGSQLAETYKKEGYPITYLNIADHPNAGQTVPHAHVHVTIASGMFEEVKAIVKVACNVLFFSWLPSPYKLSDKALEVQIAKEQAIIKKHQ